MYGKRNSKKRQITMKSTYIIGEIGQNHNGSVDIAKLLVELVARPIHEDVFDLESIANELNDMLLLSK